MVDAAPKHAFSYEGGDIVFTDEHTTLTKCGNLLRFSSIVTNSQHFLLRQKPSAITAFDANCKVSEIALAAYEEHAEISMYTIAEKKFRGKLKQPVGLVSSIFEYYLLKFSRCGTRLLSVGTDTTNQLTLWDVERFEAIEGCQTSLPHRVTFASFSPLNPDCFVTGSDENVIFWRICKGQIGYCFSRIEGSLSHDATREQKVLAEVSNINEHLHGDDRVDDIATEKRHQYLCHCWDKNGNLLVSNQMGDVIRFDATTGAILSLVALSRSVVVTSMLLTSEYLIVAFSDGALRWMAPEDFSTAQAVAIPSKISSLGISPSYSVLVVGTCSGALYELKVYVDVGDDDEKSAVITPTCHGIYHTGPILSLTALIPSGGTNNDAVILSGGVSGLLHVWTVVGCRSVMTIDLLEVFDSKSSTGSLLITCISARYLDPIVLIGDGAGRLRILCLTKSATMNVEVSPLHNVRLTSTALDMIEIHPSLPLALVASSFEKSVFVISLEPEKQFRVVGFVTIPDTTPRMIKWVPTSSLESTYFLTMTSNQVYYSPLTNLDDRSTIELNLLPIGNTISPSQCGHGGVFLLTPGKILIYFDHNKKGLHLLKIYDAPGTIKDIELKNLIENGHDKPLTCIARSILSSKDGHEIVATGGADGVVTLWIIQTKRSSSAVSLKDIEITIEKEKSIILHCGSILTLFFLSFDDYFYLYSCGIDGTIYCIDIKLNNKIILNKNILEGASPLYLNKNEKKIRLLLIDDIKPYIEKYNEEKEYFIRTKYDTIKDTIRQPLGEIQLKLKTMLQNNSDLPILEKLERDEFVINQNQQNILLKQNETRMNEVRRNISRQIAEMNIIRERMKIEFWDTSEIKGVQLHGFQIELKVYNFPIRKLTKIENKKINLIQNVRQMEYEMTLFEPNLNQMDSLLRRKSSLYQYGEIIPGNISWMVNAGLLHPSLLKKITDNSNLINDKIKKQTIENNLNENKTIRLVDLIYHPAMIRTKKQQRTQIHLLAAYERQLLHEFNIEFNEMVKLKETKMDEIESKNNRIREICNELNITETITTYRWHVDEQVDTVMSINENEMTKTPYETEEMRKIREKNEIKQREIDEKNRKDDVAGRALNDMMNGTLDVKKETIVTQTMQREAWMDEIPPDELTTEQKQKIQQYEAEILHLYEEKEKYKKSLDLELKKLKLDILDICKQYDEKLKQLNENYLATQMSILTQQMYILQLGEVLMDHEHCNYEKKILENEIIKLKKDENQLNENILQFQARYEICREDLQKAIEEDKICEKSFPKDMEDAIGTSIEYEMMRSFIELYRKRRHGDDLKDDGININKKINKKRMSLNDIKKGDISNNDE